MRSRVWDVFSISESETASVEAMVGSEVASAASAAATRAGLEDLSPWRACASPNSRVALGEESKAFAGPRERGEEGAVV